MELLNRNTLSFLPSYWGEANIPVTLHNHYELIKNFGLPQTENYKMWYNIYNYLKYQDTIDVIRPLSVNMENKMLNLYDDSIPVSDVVTEFYNTEIADLSTITTEDDRVFSIVEKFCNTNESLAVVICSTLANWKNPVSSEFVDKIKSRTVTDPSSLEPWPEDQDTYIVADNAILDWDGQDGMLAIWDADATQWNFISTVEGGSYFIEDENGGDGLEVYKSGDLFIERTTASEYIDYDIHTYIRRTYTSLHNSDGSIKNCNQIFNIQPDFTNDEFAVFVFKLNSLNLFDLVEKYICSTDEDADNYYDTMINGVSNYIYLKYFSGIIDTNVYSILNNLLIFDDVPIDYISVLPADFQDTIDTINYNDYNIVINNEIDSSMAYIPTKCIDTTCMCITSAWKDYSTLTDLINDFGIYAETSTGYTIHNKNNLIIGNYKKQYDSYNDKKVLQPFGGDVAGYILTGLLPDFADSFEVILYGFEDKILLKENKINLAEKENVFKSFFTTELNKPKFKYGYNVLIQNKISKAIIEIINNTEAYKPPFERYKDRIWYLLTGYLDSLCDVDIDGYNLEMTLDEDTKIINIVITVSYYSVIESITVNFSATVGNLNETMLMTYKDK